jgi:dTDP-4-amino-4,6-dideoxygalactose transaminase
MYIDDEIKKAATDVIDSGIYINGPQAKQFEKEFAAYIGVKRAVSVNSGTSALFIVFMNMGLQPGDEVIVPSHTFIASASQAIHLGAKPVFVEAELRSMIMDIDDVKRKITPKTKAIVAVHLYGHPVDMDPLMELAKEHNLIIVEDCAQAHGSKYKGRLVGSIGHFGCFSFFPSKIMNVGGDGGIITTNNEAAADRMTMLKNHGRKDKYLHELFGMNMRMPEIPAAIGRVQLSKLPMFIKRRKEIVNFYNENLSSITSLEIPYRYEWADPVYYVYTFQTENRDELAKYLKSKGIETGIYYPVPLHQQPIIQTKFGIQKMPITEKICSRIISPPLSPVLTNEEMEFIVDSIKAFYKKE